MTVRLGSEWTALKPPFRSSASRKSFTELARSLSKVLKSADDDGAIDTVREEFVEATRISGYVDAPTLLAAGMVISDLAMQGWRIRVSQGCVEVSPPERNHGDRAAEKARIRRQELVKRDAQLRKPAVKAFLSQMERNRLFGSKFVSIFSLMRDGRELAVKLRDARKALVTNSGLDALKGAIDPYIEFVRSETSTCEHTGFRLMDIWRYFRHTWTNQYTSVPGRSMMFLVRDRAAPFHPVVGIGALCSPVMQLRERDEWIGWQPESFLRNVRENPSQRIADWIDQIVENAIAELYVADFIEDGLLTVKDLASPSKAVIERLIADSAERRSAHHRFARQSEHKRAQGSVEDGWTVRARSHLFRSKRAQALATYLKVKMAFAEFGPGKLTSGKLGLAASSSRGAEAIRKVLRKAKADRVGICLADISVCGAVQPYNAILGGKLVAMLATSPEVVAEYRQRYSNAESEIASAMAGRPIRRSPSLVLLGTTSLYGVGSSQYNRIRIPAEKFGGKIGEGLKYQELGHSEAFGTSQYSDETVEALTELAQQSADGQRVNSIFGEGVSPKLRKVRQGLDLLEMPSDVLLRHHRHRIVYAVGLIRNLREFLLGLDTGPDYIVPPERGSRATAEIASWWRERWLRNRIALDEVLAQVERHTLIRPIKHGARVAVLPNKIQPGLFADDQ